MNTCVSDDENVVNIQGIRYATWGESSSIYSSKPGRPWYVTVHYKGTHQTFQYKTEEEARSFFNKIRMAMDKTVLLTSGKKEDV